MPNEVSLLFLAPQLYGAPGGVQAYMRCLREIMNAYGRLNGREVHCISLIDVEEEKPLHLDPPQGETFVGCAGNKLRFVFKATQHVLRRTTDVAVVGHIGQIPVAWMLRHLGFIRTYILVLHGIEAWKKIAWLDRIAARHADRIVATTQYTAREFCKHNGIQQNLIQIIPLAVPEERIETPDRGEEGNRELALLTVGRLSTADRPKGTDILIRAVDKAQKDGAMVRLTVVGNGDDLPRLKELASYLRLDRSVSFLGTVSEERLQQLYRECDVFAMPSKKEGFGIVFLEAMRHKKPCIGGNHGGIPEVIDHGIDGYLVDYGDVDQLAQYLVQFSQKPALVREMGLKSYEKVKAKHLFPHMRKNWFQLLNEFMGQ